MSKLYFRIYLYFVVFTVVFGIAASVGWLAHVHGASRIERFDAMGRLLAQSLPEDGTELVATLEALARDMGVGLALHDSDLRLVATAGSPLPPPLRPEQRRKGWHHSDIGHILVFTLPDGRLLSAHLPWRRRGYVIEMLVVLVAFAAVAAYPLARAITRRLERLKTRVDALGAGDLSARVEVEGWDEVAALANSFNRAAARIETLVSGQRTMLASVSHELRTPLARMRVAIELLATDPRPELRERIERDVVELDNLIDELLLASRLQVAEDLDAAVPVDLLALAAEEGTRVGAVVTGDAMSISGNRRLLRHLMRNLFENAERHGAGSPIDAWVGWDRDGVSLRICDGGPGIPDFERERIFEPFYRSVAVRETGLGVGLGLHLVKTIAERHGATIECHSNEPDGSCFVVRFPAEAASA